MLVKELIKIYRPYGKIASWEKLALKLTNDRFDLAIIQELENELKILGYFKKPISLSKDRKVVTDGIHRILAALRYGLKDIDTIFIEDEPSERVTPSVEAVVSIKILESVSEFKEQIQIEVFNICKSFKVDDEFWNTCAVTVFNKDIVELYFNYPHNKYVEKVEQKLREKLSRNGLGPKTLVLGTEKKII